MKPRRKLHVFSDSLKAAFRTNLLAWYDEHARELPWRESRDPYRVWVSEVMLQQTRVEAVIAHYHEFLRRFPTDRKLAAAREASVLAAWSGLGYYRRARMLHAAAKIVTRDHGGKFPETIEALRELPGIGRYTAAAIASIAFGKTVAAVDGNVERVLQRLSGKRLAGEVLWESAEDLLDRRRPGDFNQAMMELGATVCTPRAPTCLMCPVVGLCAVRGEMAANTKSVRQIKREICFALDWRRGEVFLVQRSKDMSLMPGMWELPELDGPVLTTKIPSTRQVPVAVLKRCASQKQEREGGSTGLTSGFTLRHSITVTDYTVKVERVAAPDRVRGKWIAVHRLAHFPLTGLARKILRKAKLM